MIRPIHIAGTKGKGSTSAFISSILTEYKRDGSPKAPQKIGLYTSPHLRFVRERIQIDNEPLSETSFAKYFFEVWDRLESSAEAAGMKPDDPNAKPIYFRFLTLMAFHTFVREGVDTAVMECGMGGEYDSTNIIVSPSVTAVTSLGIDHVETLGRTLPEIAWHKAGVFKRGAPAFVSPQPQEAMEVLEERAAEKNVPLHVVERHPEIDTVKLGLAADFQKTNASLAIATTAAHLRVLGNEEIPDPTVSSNTLPAAFRRGLELVRWPGRCDIRREQCPDTAWYIDGAHTLDSIDFAGRWFASEINSSSQTSSKVPRILVFNQQKRDAAALATSLHSTLSSALGDESDFSHVVFCTNVTFKDAGYKPDLVSMNTNSKAVNDLTVQKQLAETWSSLDGNAEVKVAGTIEEAVNWCRSISKEYKDSEVKVLVTGSLHLVGGLLDVLESGKE